MKRSSVIVLVLSLVGCGALASVAQGHDKSYKVGFSPIQRTLNPGVGYDYSGTLQSKEKGCLKSVVDVRVGPLGDYYLVKSDKQGNWVVSGAGAYNVDNYPVEAFSDSKLGLNNSKHKHLCKPGHGLTTFPAVNPFP